MRRSAVYAGAWVGAAAGAIGLGFLAVSLVDAGVAAAPAAATFPATSTPTGGNGGTLADQAGTEGGMVYAVCTAGQLSLGSAPLAGWWVDDSSTPGTVEFRDGTRKIEVVVTCGATGPVFSVEGPVADDASSSPEPGDDHGDARDSGSATPAGSAPAGPTVDDHGGGSGSGDSGSGGSGSGGSGSGDSGSGGHGADG